METRKLSNWENFETELRSIELEISSFKKTPHDYISEPLYRGQSKTSYKLETTLDRYFKRPVKFDSYQRYLTSVKPAIESFTEQKFVFDFRNEPEPGWKFMGDVKFLKGQYEYMAYLRHHGFPSPLLDWSKSPYVALYFAYEDAIPSEDVAVYVYVEHLGRGKGGSVGSPEIATFGHYVPSHKRHFLQQSQYTACIKKDGDTWFYCSHDEAFIQSQGDHDLVIKLELPSGEKEKILAKLDTMNINAFSLFGSEEGLMKMLAFRERHVVD